ncbi:hypothetical protein [Viridibacillus arvi]|uniref:hypothetical protein n=1 Tax=Viridibacillus arvi TaxID=263475 RepID=UPI003D2ACEC1
MPRKDLTFTRSTSGLQTKYDEAIKILEYSIMMVELFDVKEFNNVIAGQLRLILCDTVKKDGVKTDNSLLRKIEDDPKLFRINELTEINNGSSVILGEMFDYYKTMIPLDDWLKQVIYIINVQGKKQSITIFDTIRFAANKSGGAHVDESLKEKAFLVDVHAERVLCQIAKGVLKAVGKDFMEDSKENISYLIKKFKEKASE